MTETVESTRPEKRLVACGEWMGCPAKDCEKGTVYVEAPERNALVACPLCDGRGYFKLYQVNDAGRLGG